MPEPLIAGEVAEPLCVECGLRIRPPTAPRCPRCDLPRGTGTGRPAACGRCDEWPAVLVAARAAAVLQPPADVLVRSLKYGGWRAAAGPMARRMCARLGDLPDPAPAALVPVPTTIRRRRRRGYNQAAELAARMRERTGLPVLDMLMRPHPTRSQVALQVAQRRANVSGAFAAGPQADAAKSHSHIILVDDVLTTGATAGAAAEVLAALGARAVSLVAFARALPRPITVPLG